MIESLNDWWMIYWFSPLTVDVITARKAYNSFPASLGNN